MSDSEKKEEANTTGEHYSIRIDRVQKVRWESGHERNYSDEVFSIIVDSLDLAKVIDAILGRSPMPELIHMDLDTGKVRNITGITKGDST